MAASVMVTLVAVEGNLWKIISAVVFGVTLVILYSVSTLYHGFRGPKKKIFQKIDHIAIYLMVLATFVPFGLVTLHGAWGWQLLALNLSLATCGILYELTLAKQTRLFSIAIYIAMGLLILVPIEILAQKLGNGGITLLALGAFSYLGGLGFYFLDEKVKHFHGYWHLSVISGSLFHYFCILLYVF